MLSFAYFSPCQNHFLYERIMLISDVHISLFVFGGEVEISHLPTDFNPCCLLDSVHCNVHRLTNI
jgi:hypothetical protein